MIGAKRNAGVLLAAMLAASTWAQQRHCVPEHVSVLSGTPAIVDALDLGTRREARRGEVRYRRCPIEYEGALPRRPAGSETFVLAAHSRPGWALDESARGQLRFIAAALNSDDLLRFGFLLSVRTGRDVSDEAKRAWKEMILQALVIEGGVHRHRLLWAEAADVPGESLSDPLVLTLVTTRDTWIGRPATGEAPDER